jgi:hypothetical protein
MPKTNIEIVRELLRGTTKSEVVNRLVSPGAVYVWLSYNIPDLKKLMPWVARTRTAGLPFLRPSTMSTLSGRSKSSALWGIFGEGENVAVFGSFTVRSVKLDKMFTSPFSIQLKLKEGMVTHMQYMEDPFGTGSTLRSGRSSKFQSDPRGGELERPSRFVRNSVL